MDELFILIKVDWTDRVQNLELTLNKLKEKGLKCNIEKSSFGQTEIKYLGFWVTRDGAKSIIKTIKEITNMKPSTSLKEFKKYIGVISYYPNM